jgi:phospholipid/cholesterol/gamma-HCH transport system substrate-binding protein
MAQSENTVTEILVGGAVLAVAVGFFFYAAQSSGMSGGGGGSYELQASFRSAEGISVGTEVRMAGVRIGTVTGMELDETTFRAETTFSVRDGIELPDDTAVSISSEGLLGGSFLEVIPGGSPFVLEPGDAIFDTQSSVSLITLLMRFVTGDGQE